MQSLERERRGMIPAPAHLRDEMPNEKLNGYRWIGWAMPHVYQPQ
jgi:hypothetical protein